MEKERKDIVSAIFLIFVGSIFLLNTTGVIGWGVWTYILRFWPIFLIFAGIKIIFNKSIVTDILLAVSALVLFIMVGIFSYISYTAKNLPFISSSMHQYILDHSDLGTNTYGDMVEETFEIEKDSYTDISRRDMGVNIGASKFSLTDDVDSDKYISVASQYFPGYIEPSISSEQEESILKVTFQTDSPKKVFRFWENRSPNFDIVLGNTNLETNLDIVLGAGEGTVTLSNLNVLNLNSKVGAGELKISLMDIAIPTKMTLDIGAGSLVLDVPENVGYTLTYDLGIGEISSNNEEIASFAGKGTNYKSSNFDTSEKKIEIVAKVGVGSLVINNI